MASKFRKPLSAKVVTNLKAKAKKSKLFNLTDLKEATEKGKGLFFVQVADQEYLCQHGLWQE